MKWAYGIRRKVSAALLLLAIFVLLFVKNTLDSQNVHKLGTSFSSVYEDRLVVESYIYRMSEHLFRKKIMIDTCEDAATGAQVQPLISKYNDAIREIVAGYEDTKLTDEESLYFERFKENVTRLADLEVAFFRTLTKGGDLRAARSHITAQFNMASQNLDSLSSIQLAEGKALKEQSQKIVADSSILTRFEIGIIVAIGLMILVLIFESTAIFARTPTRESLN